MKDDLISILITTILIINPFSFELFIYIEKSVMMLSILFCVMAVEHMIKFFEGSKKNILYALILMFLANSSYQGTVGFFVSLSLFYILKYSKDWKTFLKNNIVVALVYAASALLNLAFIKLIFTNQRISGERNIFESLKKIFIETSKMFLDTRNILPKYFFASSILLISLYIIYRSLKSKDENEDKIKDKTKEKIIKILKLIYIIIGTTAVAVLPQMLQVTSEIWIVARTAYPLASLIGLLLLYLYSNYNINLKERNIIIFTIILFLTVQFIGFMKISVGNYASNAIDKEISLQIKDMTEKYEKESGYKIDTISIYRDKNMVWIYEGITGSGDVNVKAYTVDWATHSILRFYLQRNLKIIEKDPKLEKAFKEKDWKKFDKEQIIFDKNIMHICLY